MSVCVMDNKIKSPEPVSLCSMRSYVSVLVFVLKQSNCVCIMIPSAPVVSMIQGVQRSGVTAVVAVGFPQALLEYEQEHLKLV